MRRIVTGAALEKLVAEAHEDHVKRLDIPLHDLEPRPRKRRARPNTALIWEACMAKYQERMVREAVRKKSA